jgi:hypothetical protein
MKNLAAALGERSIEFLRIYDNSAYPEASTEVDAAR